MGKDQLQHLELARDIANSFHNRYKSNMFPLPRAIMTKCSRVMSLRNAKIKMSKSDPSDASRINLTDSDEAIRSKIRKATSDSLIGVYTHPDRPEISNLISIYHEIWRLSHKSSFQTEEASLKTLSTNDFKERLAEALIAHLAPIRRGYELLRKDPDFLTTILITGQNKAFAIANQTMDEITSTIGIKI